MFTSHQPVIVTATRGQAEQLDVPYAISKIDIAGDSRFSDKYAMAELLATVPGVTAQDRHNRALGERVMMRGIGSRAQFGVRGVKILLDNIPLTMPDGQAQTGLVDPSGIQEVEVIRGPAATLYGNAAGGVIQLRTMENPREEVDLNGKYTRSSFGTNAFTGSISSRSGANYYLLNASNSISDGYREHSAANYSHVTGLARYQLRDNMQMTGVVHYYNAPYLLNPSSLGKKDAIENPTMARYYIKQQGAGEKVDHIQGGLTLKYQLPDGGSWESTVYGIHRDLYNPIPGRIIDLRRFSGGVRSVVNLEHQILNRNIGVTAGVDASVQQDHRREYENRGIADSLVGQIEPSRIIDQVRTGYQLLNQWESVRSLGPFVKLRIPVHQKVSLNAGGRWNYFRFQVEDNFIRDGMDDSDARTMQQFNPMLGVTVRPTGSWNMYGNFATAFQTPTTSELSNRPTGEGGFSQSLEPELIRSVEAGSRGFFQRMPLRWDVALFHMQVRNMLIPYQSDVPGVETVYFTNAGSAVNTGGELRVQYQPHPQWAFSASFTRQVFRFTDYLTEVADGDSTSTMQLDGNLVPGVPEATLSGVIRYSHPLGIWSSVTSRYSSSYYANNFNGPPTDGASDDATHLNSAYMAIDLSVGSELGIGNYAIELSGQIGNLLDERYNSSVVPNAFGDRYFEPAPGRTWRASISFRWK
ncbi:MAG: TonB-dependent receptor [Candidatus Marinimicrobia bacterium]|nr:TonB-dependent receptor [Candidatus Neomarinimicrobiota bacterium]MCF7828655.1 TonB-dependent receptor [Candidatus Neomarinimicrobiota bacterium]MCF7880396.1 TonB-dependent receptor [Candidatus Neomarinimicrobiota bacterium]